MNDEGIKFISDIYKTPILSRGGCACLVMHPAGTFVGPTLEVILDLED